MKKYNWSLYAAIFSIIIVLDRVTKYFITQSMPRFEVNSLLSVDYLLNRGISWGFFHSDKAATFSVVTCLIAIVILFLLFHIYLCVLHGKSILGETFMLAGAVSNICDRFYYGGVVDFIAISYHQWHFPVFNIADIFIVCGVGIVLFFQYRDQ